MTVEFDYTLEDLKEAGRAYAKAAGKGFGPRSSWGVPMWLGYVLVVSLAVLFFMLLQRHPTAVPATPPIAPPPGQNNVWTNIVLPVLPWVVVFGFVWFFFYRTRAQGVQRVWDSEPGLQLHKRLEVNEQRFLLEDGRVRIEQQWSGFRRFIESPNLFLLYTSDLAFHMVPKRAFAAPAQLDEFRRLIEQQIQPPTGGFPVQSPFPPAAP